MRTLERAKKPPFLSFSSVFRVSIFLMGLVLALGGTALSQGTERKEWGYGFAAFGAAFEPGCCGEGIVHFGGGGEAALLGGFGPAAEIGYLLHSIAMT